MYDPITATYMSSTSFTVADDLTSEFPTGMRVYAYCGTDGDFIGSVTSSSYNSGTSLTTVSITLDSGSLTSNLTGVLHGSSGPDSLPRSTSSIMGAVQTANSSDIINGTNLTKFPPVSALRQGLFSIMRDGVGSFPGFTSPSMNLFCGSYSDDSIPNGTFTRSTVGSRLGNAGLLESVNAGSLRREWKYDSTLYGWLVEPAATNLVKYSETIGTGWTLINIGVSSDSCDAPDGNSTADTLIPDASSAGYSIYQAVATTIGLEYCFSFYAKENGYNYVGMTLYDTSPVMTIFDVSTGTVATGTGIMKNVGNGWYRCSVVFTATKTTCYARLYAYSTNAISNYSGDGTSGICVWGGQLESGDFPTSYILTTTASVARSSDVWNISVDNSWFREDKGTLFVNAHTAGLGTQNLIRIDDESSANTIYLYRHGTSRSLVARIFANSVDVLSSTMAVLSDFSTYKIAITWYDSGYIIAINGSIASYGTLIDIPTGITSIRIGSSVSGSSQWAGHMSHICYFPTSLSAEELVGITT